MNIYLVRHGAAEDKFLGKQDSERELTDDGKKEFKKAVKLWIHLIPSIDYLISSPFKRAIQTAYIVKDIFNFRNEVIKDDRLKPGSTIDNVINLVNEFEVENILLFGHEPDFSQHISNLISSSGANIDLKKGAVAKVSFPGKARVAGGVLEFLIPQFLSK